MRALSLENGILKGLLGTKRPEQSPIIASVDDSTPSHADQITRLCVLPDIIPHPYL